ncbi:MAG TPA: exosome complex exonuclease Rrp41 [Candidatus Nanoarchaeia archaeon]|nr:exosome complex exonuclease Rrp41 [Candidatus Nanoarchaeia archaeon]
MVYDKRFDGRKFDQLREVDAKIGVIPNATGSAMFRIGKTIAIAAVYAPKPLFPQFLQNDERGVLKCEYNMVAFSGSGERVRPGPSRRSKELSLVIEKALMPVLDLKEYANCAVDVNIELVQTDAGTRCAGICAASLALADAGISMSDLISAVAVGRIEDKIVLDVNKEEEDYEKGMADIAVAYSLRLDKITLLQADGELTKEQLKRVIEMAKFGCNKIREVQIKALKDKFMVK